MRLSTRLLALALVALAVASVVTVRAQDEDDDGVPRGEQGHGDVPLDPKVQGEDTDTADDEVDALPEEEEEESQDAQTLSVKAVFLGEAAGQQFKPGEWVETLVSFGNSDESTQYTVRFVAAHINQLGDASAYVQNFTGNAYERVIEGRQSGTFKYRFRPHESLDPRDYNLVVRVFFTTNDNTTLAIAAFNDTITIQEPTGTDPETIMTFVTIAGIIGGGVYWFRSKRSRRAARTSSTVKQPVTTVEMGSSSSYDEAYVSPDHLRYQEALKSKSHSPKRSSSNK